MSLIHFYTPHALLLLWLVPVVAGLFIYAAAKRKQAIKAFGADSSVLVGHKREAVGTCVAMALVILALARPAWDLQEKPLQESGRDVIFLLDVSRSMLAEDLHPNRLENAKIAILDCIEALSGDRVGLVLFAGSAEIRCPLTTDYEYFRMALRQASPESVAAGGTMIGHAVERTLNKLLDPAKAGLQDIILITDGEDTVDDSFAIEAAQKLGQAQARLIAIGLGDRLHGSRIVLKDEETGTRSFLKYDHREVWTKLHAKTLKKMVDAVPDGLYFEVAKGPFNLRQIYRQVMEHASSSSTAQQVVESYKEKFPLFLGGAIATLLLSNRWRKVQ
jgi:uncharacterized protein YegL